MLRKTISTSLHDDSTFNGDTEAFNVSFFPAPEFGRDADQAHASDGSRNEDQSEVAHIDFAMVAEAAKNGGSAKTVAASVPSGPIQDFKQFWTTADLPTDS